MSEKIWLSIAAMAVSTYLIRVLPMILFTRPFRSKWIQSFLYYVPYAVLSAMTFPAMLSGDLPMAACAAGMAAAVVMAWNGRSLLQVALSAAAAAWVVSMLI